MSRGLEIAGRVLDPSGRPLGDLEVWARGDGSSTPSFARALPDGAFRLRGLADGAYTVSGGSEAAGFGYQAGVLAGATDVRLTLRPTSRVLVRVLDLEGKPVAKALARLETVGGALANFPGRTAGATDQSGSVELVAPEGAITLVAESENRAGSPASVDISLTESLPTPTPRRP
jgi:hypothetical protein